MKPAIDPFHILVAGLTLEFSVSADVNLSIGAQFDYTKGTRYIFTLLLFSKQSTSDQLDLVDETYNFDFYVMGTLGLRAGVIARVELGLFTLSLDSIGLELESWSLCPTMGLLLLRAALRQSRQNVATHPERSTSSWASTSRPDS